MHTSVRRFVAPTVSAALASTLMMASLPAASAAPARATHSPTVGVTAASSSHAQMRTQLQRSVPALAAAAHSSRANAATVNRLMTAPTSADLNGVVRSLDQQGVAFRTRIRGAVESRTYSLAEANVTFTRPVTASSVSGPRKALRAKANWSGVYVYLNRTDQGALATGGAAALAVAICAIPAVGWAACAVVTGALATAAYYIATNGICRNEMEIRLLPSRRIRCV